MPVTPTPRTIALDLGEEYFALLDMASRVHGLSHQAIMREALTMLHDAKFPEAAPLDQPGRSTDFDQACLTAWDRWSEHRGQRLPLPDDLAALVDQLLSKGVARDATGVVMLALLRYARVRDFLPLHEDDES